MGNPLRLEFDMSTTESSKASQPTLESYAAKPVQVVREHPIPASLVMFGIGLGIGVLFTSKACEAMTHQETTSERLSRQFSDALTEIKNTLQRGFSSMK